MNLRISFLLLCLLTFAGLCFAQPKAPTIKAAIQQDGFSNRLTPKQIRWLVSHRVSARKVGQVSAKVVTSKDETYQVNTQKFQARIRMEGGKFSQVLYAVSCTGTCGGGCGPQGCEPDEDGCTNLICGAGCDASCSKTVTTDDDFMQILEVQGL